MIRFLNEVCPTVVPVPPCNSDNGVVSPVKDVISEFAPDLAALKLLLAVVLFSTSDKLFAR